MRRFSLRWLAPVATALAVVSPALGRAAGQEETAARVEFFETRVRPILAGRCYACHSAETKPAGELRVDDRNGLLTGGNSGPAVVPGDPEASLLLKRVRHADARRRMPKESDPLDAAETAALEQWIRDGAHWPALQVPESLTRPKEWYDPIRKEHWAWQPLTSPTPPADLSDPAWPADDIDRFVLAGLDAAGLKPVADADRLSLLRRVTFDLTGLPPTPEAIDAFLADQTPDAYERVVDRLLASPAYGERWGRHWLDVARYGESTGPSRNIPYPFAPRYRDYVIDSLNADVPYDRFITEQIAGDLLPAPAGPERDRLLTATGFLALGVKDVNQRFKVRFVMDNVDDQIDAVSRSVLGLTVSCARCHDHKFDPIPTADYYALAGIFTSTENAAGVRNKMGGGGLDYYDPKQLVLLTGELPPVPAEQAAELEARVAQAKAAWDAIRGTPEGLAKDAKGQPRQRPFRLEYERLNAELLALTDPAARGFAVHGVRDASTVGDTEIRIRGEAEKLGPVVPRGFLTAFEVPDAPAVNREQSGRLELAQWLTSPRNPLAQRVVVNRVWHHLFGRGLVATVDNFGTTGDAPSHPELLDHLASRFVREGSSLKRLVRSIVLSRTYRLSSTATPAHLAADPGNVKLWRYAPRRLEAEELRDAILAASGALSSERPGEPPVRALAMVELRDNGPEARRLHESAEASTARSLYLPALRGVTPRSLAAFDPVEQTLVTGSRESTTVPSQALFLLNSGFVRRQALGLAERLLAVPQATDADRVRQAYRLTLGREPSPAEVVRALAYLADAEAQPLETEPSVSLPSQAVAQAAPSEATATTTAQPANPDEADQTGEAIAEPIVVADSPRTAAWLAFTQALFGSAEFRYVR